MMMQQLAIVVLIAVVVVAVTATTTTIITTAYGQGVNETQQEQKPTEEKQGGEYSGFEETQKQTEGIPNQQANPTPQAPISDLNVQQKNQTTAAAGTAAVGPASQSGIAMLAGIGAVIAAAVVAAAWYFKRNKR
jgi:flagellar biogenesis protein FliO